MPSRINTAAHNLSVKVIVVVGPFGSARLLKLASIKMRPMQTEWGKTAGVPKVTSFRAVSKTPLDALYVTRSADVCQQ